MACQHLWDMSRIRFGFVAFEKCFHCGRLRTSFSAEPQPFLGDEYREGDCYWSRVENAQSFRFALSCRHCDAHHELDELMGLLHCTGCDPSCRVDVLRRAHEEQGEWVLVAFGFVDQNRPLPVPADKLLALAAYFNQRRAPTRPRLCLLPAELIGDFGRCRGDFLHDVGMLSQEPPPATRPSPFELPGSGRARPGDGP